MADTKFEPQRLAEKWSKIWQKHGVFVTDITSDKPKFYNLWMFPYPSAEGLHAGHAFSSTGSDVYGKYMRMQGKEVFQPIGYDSFGIHSENYAIKIGQHPAEMMKRTTSNYQRQLSSLGHGYDWSRTVATHLPDYYRWTQWLFVQLFKAGLAYRKPAKVNWCPGCKTVLADEQVIEGQCERCQSQVEKKNLEQWFFRITYYADRLLENLDKIDWPEKIKTAQRNWIGRKVGININYPIVGTDQHITCFTTRPDTNFGATFIVIAPEHPVIEQLKQKMPDYPAVQAYVKQALQKSDQERLAEGRKKTGVFTGLYATNQLTGEQLPIWVSDFVLMDFGTGAVVGVPGHDKRDFEFAQAMHLPIKRVVVGKDGDRSEITRIEQVQEDEGVMVNSQFLDGMDIHQATEKMMDYLEEKGWGKRVVSYHLRDWLISRQRYWGPPIPMIYCQACAKQGKSWFTQNSANIRQNQHDWQAAGWYPVPEDDLPVKLPLIDDFQPKGTGRGPLADHPEFYQTSCPACGSPAERETDVSDTFLDSSWYFLRYPSVSSTTADQLAFDPEITRHWLPVDLYFGGAEHAVLHLMYARFVTQVLYDLKQVEFEEPFPKFYAHGLVIKDGAKMSKSRGNVVNPDEYINKYGADVLRLYLMFMGPMDGYPDFRDTGIRGAYRWLEKVYRLLEQAIASGPEQSSAQVVRATHRLIKQVSADLEEFKYNTAIAKMRAYINLVVKDDTPWGRQEARSFLQMLAVFTPFLAEELWAKLQGKDLSNWQKSDSIHLSSWPEFDPKLAALEQIIIPVQVNGKLRGELVVSQQQLADQELVVNMARQHANVSKYLTGKIKQVIYVPGRVLNLIV